MSRVQIQANTLAERMGFRDPDLATPAHDEIMCWLDANAETVINHLTDRQTDQWYFSFDDRYLKQQAKPLQKACHELEKKLATVRRIQEKTGASLRKAIRNRLGLDGWRLFELIEHATTKEEKELVKVHDAAGKEEEHLEAELQTTRDKLSSLEDDLHAAHKCSAPAGVGKLTVIKQKWEQPVGILNPNTNYQNIAGFVDLYVHARLIFSGVPCKCGHGHWQAPDRDIQYVFEVKPGIPSLGELMRQLAMYRQHLDHPHSILQCACRRVVMVVVSPDDRFFTQLRSQGIWTYKYTKPKAKKRKT
jgi:hypothetical protein